MAPCGRGYPRGMTTHAMPAPASEPAAPARSTTRTTAAIAAAVFAVFGAYTLWVIAGHGLLGFLTLAGREPWALQLLIDLLIACSIALGWVIRDARRRGLAAWPYVILTFTCGSLGLLVYLARRGLR